MKYIIAVIQPDRLDEVLDRLTEKEIHLVTVSNALGRGRQRPPEPRLGPWVATIAIRNCGSESPAGPTLHHGRTASPKPQI